MLKNENQNQNRNRNHLDAIARQARRDRIRAT